MPRRAAASRLGLLQRASAGLSSSLCSWRRSHQMGLMWAAIDGADALDQFGGGQQAIWFHDLALAVQPLGFDRIEPGTLAGQQGTDEARALARELYLAVVLAHPGPDDLAVVAGRVVA